ncbi:hypothetical protein BN1195_03612 [Chryseobacterium oranimense G311]|nr:hypothetical protein BN1195_03612 [Chryseobacterium oranimense G311]DAG72867.1 MAG TPA: hypothetical protein [Caudoviricetes sp.]
MKNMVNQIDKLLKEGDGIPAQLKKQLETKKEILSNDKTVKK